MNIHAYLENPGGREEYPLLGLYHLVEVNGEGVRKEADHARDDLASCFAAALRLEAALRTAIRPKADRVVAIEVVDENGQLMISISPARRINRERAEKESSSKFRRWGG